VRHEQDGAVLGLELGDLGHALASEVLVTDGENLVDEQDVGIDVDRDGEAQPHVHTRRVVLDRVVDERLELGEVHDGVEESVDLAPGQTEQRGV